MPIVNKLMDSFDLVVATQDWHPADHGSFATQHDRQPGEIIDLHGIQQVLWPVHCVQNSPGADFHADLHTANFHKIFQKGTNPKIDSYSGFYDNDHRQATGLGKYLKSKDVNEVFIAGLATDYCVKFTAQDGCAFNFKTNVIEDATRGVNLNPGDVTQAIADMKSKGVIITQSSELLKRL